MTAPVTYTREQREEAAEHLEDLAQWPLLAKMPEDVEGLLEAAAILRQAATDDSRYHLHIYSLRAYLEYLKADGKLPSEIGDRLLASYIDMPDPEGGNPEALNNTPRQAAAEGQGNTLTAERRFEIRRLLGELESAEAHDRAITARGIFTSDDFNRLHGARLNFDCAARNFIIEALDALDAIALAATPTEPTPPQFDGLVETSPGVWTAPNVRSIFDEPTPPPTVGRCKTCKWFATPWGTDANYGACEVDVPQIPAAGSGFCHLHSEAK